MIGKQGQAARGRDLHAARGSAGIEKSPDGSGRTAAVFGLTNAELPIDVRRPQEQPPRVDAFMAGLYTDQADEPTDEKIFDVWNCKMRS